MDIESIYEVIIGLGLVLWYLFKWLAGRNKDEAPAHDDADDWEPTDDEWPADSGWPDELRDELPDELQAFPGEPMPAAPDDPFADRRRRLREAALALATDAQTLSRDARVDRATARIASVLDDYVAPRAGRLADELRTGTGQLSSAATEEFESLQVCVGAVETFVHQRRVPGLRRALGDADAIAAACYQPVLDFARMNVPELASATPVTVLTPFDLGIWTGFLPTGVAPLFLPRDFFSNLAWWPALAHEIGHDFLAATGGAERALRRQLGLPDEPAGQRPLALSHGTLHPSELVRVFGAWFEEIFCDAFGTMMMGPAYGHTMSELFAQPDWPEQVVRVQLDSSGRGYDIHPPRHLRVMWSCRMLELIGEDEAAKAIRAGWLADHGEPGPIVFPVVGGQLPIPTHIPTQIGEAILETLYREPLDGLDGHSLADIPGLDYGTHRAAEVRRARDELLGGRAPAQQRPRAVVAGAVLAWLQARDQHDDIIALARRAIVGITETREDAYAIGRPGDRSTPQDRPSLREAFILHTILSPPPSLARYRGAERGFLSRRSWP